MAILSGVRGLNVQIRVNGRALKEYDGDEENRDPKTVTKYIEATSGAQFDVHFTFGKRFPHKQHSIVYEVALDGITASRRVVDGSDIRSHRPYCTSSDGVHTLCEGCWTKQKFSFSQLAIGMYLSSES